MLEPRSSPNSWMSSWRSACGQLPTKPFGVAEVKRALGAALKEAGGAIELKAGDDRWMAERLDGHPFLLRAKAGASWQPGLNKGALKRA
jgi:hypothetical protein